MSERRVAYVIGFSAPPVLQLGDFIRLLQARDWDTYVILSPTAATWVDVNTLAGVSGHAVRVEPRLPTDLDPLPPADAVFAAPITFSGLNKWAAGISDTLVLGLLNEALGLKAPITAAPCVNEALRRHPAYALSVARLSSVGVAMLDPAAIVERTPSGFVTIGWHRVLLSQRP